MHRRYDSYRPSAQRNDSHRRSYSRSRKRSRSQSSSRSRSRSEERDRGRGRSPRTREHWEQEASLDRIALEHRARSPRRTRLQSRSPSITQGHRLDSTVLRSFRDRKWPRIHNSRSRSSSITRTEAVIRSGSVTSSSETTSRAGSLSRGVTPETITSQYNADPLKPNDTSSPSSLPADDAISPSPLLAPPSTETSNGGNTGIPKVSQNKDKKADFDEPHFSCEQTSLDQALIDSAEKPLSPAARVSPCPGNQPPQPNDMLEQDDIPETSQQRPPTERYFYIRCKESDLNVAQRENIWPTNPLYDESFRKAYDIGLHHLYFKYVKKFLWNCANGVTNHLACRENHFRPLEISAVDATGMDF
ncbi:hypothetical protein BX616_006053 [Lobosporangium transversale]|nr:hypothetical protein BX616_006053 [Lobosporangium transversale]